MRSLKLDTVPRPDERWRQPNLFNGWTEYDQTWFRVIGRYLEVLGGIQGGTLGNSVQVMVLPGLRLRQRVLASVTTDGTTAGTTRGDVMHISQDGVCTQNFAWQSNTVVWLNFRVPLL